MRRIRRDLHKRVGSSGYQQIAGDLEVRGRLLGPTTTSLASGIAKRNAVTSTPAMIPTPIATAAYRSIVVRWDTQFTLVDLDHYDISVAENAAGPWLAPSSDGINWGYVEGWIPTQGAMFVHNNIPHAGTEANPVGRTLYYRVRQVTKSGQEGPWSLPCWATTTVVSNGDVMANTLTANKVLASEIATFLLRAQSVVLLGYNGLGTNDNPQEGDRRCYQDGDEIGLQIYTDGAWSTERQVSMGGVDTNGNFRPFLACRGIFADMVDVPTGDALPDAGIWRFNFDNDKDNQYGVDPWTVNTGTPAYSATAWEGSYSLSPSGVALLNMNYGGAFANPWTAGDSVTGAFMFRVASPASGLGHALLEWNASSLADHIYISISWDLKLTFRVDKNATQTSMTTDALALDTWYFIGLTYNSVTNTCYMWVNDTEYTMTPSGTWGAATAKPFYLNLMGSGLGVEYMDDFIVSFWRSIDPDLFRQHVQRGVAWTADYIADDIVLEPRKNYSTVHVKSDTIRIDTAKTPTHTGFGLPGMICWDSGYLYVCIERNHWYRAALSAY